MNTRLKILMISLDRDLFNPTSDSARRHVRLGAYAAHLHIIVAANRNYRRIDLSPQVTIYPTRHWSPPGFFLAAAKLGARVIAEAGVDLLSSQDPLETGWVGLWLSAQHRLPLLVQYHGVFLDNPFWLRENPLNFLRNSLGKWTLRRADGIRAVSKRNADYLRDTLKINPELMEVYPLPIARIAPVKAPAKPLGDSTIAAAGRLAREKNFPLLLQAVKRVKVVHPEVKLILAGDGPERGKIKRTISRLHLEGTVELTGRLPNLSSLWPRAMICISSSNHEGWGRVSAEALLAGVPVISTDTGIAGEIVQHGVNGLVTPVGEVEPLAQAILRLLENPSLYQSLRQGTRNGAAMFPSEDAILMRYAEHWAQTVNRSRIKRNR